MSGRQLLGLGEPSRLGGYQILERLGEDDDGVSYLGRSESGTLVTVTRLARGVTIDPVVRDRLQDGSATPEDVDARCVARVLDIGADGEAPLVVTEFAAGPALAEAVREHGPLPVTSLNRLAISTATGLLAIHQAGLAHRAINPMNVRLRPDGGQLLGLGIVPATCQDPAAPVTEPARAAYLAPEQVLGRPCGPCADVFAWASTIVFAATGHSPFTASNPRTQMHQIVHWTPDLIAVPMPLARILDLCLTKTPEDRPTAARLLTLLVATLPPASRPEGPPDQERTANPPADAADAPRGADDRPGATADDLTATSAARRPGRPPAASLALIAVLVTTVVVALIARLASSHHTVAVGQVADTTSRTAPSSSRAPTTPRYGPDGSTSSPTATAAATSAASAWATSATSATHPASPVPPVVPAAFAGNWSGLVHQPPGDPAGLPVTVALSAGTGTGTFALPTLGCRATLQVTRVRAAGRQLTLDERLGIDPGGRCAAAARLVLTLDSPTSLRLSWQDALNAGNTAAGVLTRS